MHADACKRAGSSPRAADSGLAPWGAAGAPARCQPQIQVELSRWSGQEPRRRPAPAAVVCRYLAHFWRKGGGPPTRLLTRPSVLLPSRCRF